MGQGEGGSSFLISAFSFFPTAFRVPHSEIPQSAIVDFPRDRQRLSRLDA
jgi:hypothetical protein